MKIIDRVLAKVNKLSVNRATRDHVADMMIEVDRAARAEVAAEIIRALREDMIDEMHLAHLDAVDLITANWACR